MKLSHIRIVLLFPLHLSSSLLLAQLTPAGLVQKVIQIESADNAPEFSAFTSTERSTGTGMHLWFERVVENPDGDLRRLIAENGKPISAARAQAEDARIARIVAHPDAFRSANQSDGTDEKKLLAAVPKLFLFSDDGKTGDYIRIRFSPNQDYSPTGYQERAISALTGTILIKEPEDRLCGIDSKISRPVEIGFGLLGHLAEGGTIQMSFVQAPWVSGSPTACESI